MPDPTPTPEPIQPPITRSNTVTEFLKAHSRDAQGGELRVGPDTGEAFLDLMNRLAFAVARKAATLARDDGGRTTLLKKDVDAAYSAIVWTEGSTAAAGPELLFSHIDRLPTDQLAVLVRRLNEWLTNQAQGHP